MTVLLCWSMADIKNAAQIRSANRAIRQGNFSAAEEIYNQLPDTPKLMFNRGFLTATAGKKDEAEHYYNILLNNKNIPKIEKAKIYFNLGNDAFITTDIKQAIQYYRKGLLLDPQNKRLKHNLELANNARLMKQLPQQQKQQQKQADQQKGEQTTPQQKQAEKMLDSFKNQELQNQLKNQNRKQSFDKTQDKQKNVEKDW